MRGPAGFRRTVAFAGMAEDFAFCVWGFRVRIARFSDETAPLVTRCACGHHTDYARSGTPKCWGGRDQICTTLDPDLNFFETSC